MVKVDLDEDTIKTIDKLRRQMEKEMGYPYSRVSIIEKALVALEDVRNGY